MLAPNATPTIHFELFATAATTAAQRVPWLKRFMKKVILYFRQNEERKEIYKQSLVFIAPCFFW